MDIRILQNMIMRPWITNNTIAILLILPRPTESFKLFCLLCLVLMRRLKLFIPWWLQTFQNFTAALLKAYSIKTKPLRMELKSIKMTTKTRHERKDTDHAIWLRHNFAASSFASQNKGFWVGPLKLAARCTMWIRRKSCRP